MALLLHSFSTNINRRAPRIWVTFAYYDPSCGPTNQNFRKLGWWQLDDGQVFNAWNVDLRTVNRYAYIYGETANDGLNWSGTCNGWLTVNPLSGFNQCAFDNSNDSQWVNFYQIDFNWAPPGWDLDVGFRDDGVLTFAASRVG